MSNPQTTTPTPPSGVIPWRMLGHLHAVIEREGSITLAAWNAAVAASEAK